MFNRKIESRSHSIMNLITQQFVVEPTSAIQPIDPKLIELHQLYCQEEALAAKIADDDQTVDKETILDVVATARKIAAQGHPTNLVSLDEMLDIAQTFCFYDPNAARIEQELVLEDPQNPPFSSRLSNKKFLGYRAELTTGPNTDTAGLILMDLLDELQDSGNPAWTARVAAALAYFSSLHTPGV